MLAIVGGVAERLRDRDAHLLRHAAQCFGEAKAVDHHHKLENVAANAAAEAMENLLGRVDGKRRGLLLVERAKAHVIRAGFAQLDVIAHNLDDISSRPYFVHLAH